MSSSKGRLWQAQLREWPDSVKLTAAEVLEWIYRAKTNEARYVRMSTMASCMQSPKGIFYRTSNRPDAWVGYRYGVQGPSYISGFGRWDGSWG